MPPNGDKQIEKAAEPIPESPEDFARRLIPSYLKLDVDGRVFRIDSFSKIITPGARIGWVTASEQVIERIVRAYEVSV